MADQMKLILRILLNMLPYGFYDVRSRVVPGFIEASITGKRRVFLRRKTKVRQPASHIDCSAESNEDPLLVMVQSNGSHHIGTSSGTAWICPWR
ncbi:hypothetical protein KC345_g16 [Hortaea werneckii]|nr:hypothetical protein KC345_g16 [Hortaea werneckii]